MVAREIISKIIPPLKTSDTGVRAMQWMIDFHVKHLPIVNHNIFLGLISEEDIINLNDLDSPIGNYDLSLKKALVHENAHLYEIIKLATELKLTIIPVVDLNDNYIGVISDYDIVEAISEMTAAKESGSIIVISMNKRDYSLTEIAKLVESEGAMILSATVKVEPIGQKCDLTLKLNTSTINSIVATLERFDYEIKESYLESDFVESLKERYDSLINYLNI